MQNAADTHRSADATESDLESDIPRADRARLREEIIRVRDNTERAMVKARRIMAGYLE
jgi:hypothetical protein